MKTTDNINSFNDLMQYGLANGWSAKRLISEAKERGWRIRQGTKELERQYTEMSIEQQPTQP